MDDALGIDILPPIVPLEQSESEDAVLIANNLDNVRIIVSIGLAIMLSISLYWAFNFVNDGGLSLVRPSDNALEIQESYSDMVQLNQVDLDGEGISVCIVDSGIDLTHPDLSSLTLAGWSDFINQESEPYDDNGHGTSMAGILVADGPVRVISPMMICQVNHAIAINIIEVHATVIFLMKSKSSSI